MGNRNTGSGSTPPKPKLSAHLFFDCGDQWKGVSFRPIALRYEEHEMTMVETAPMAIIDCAIPTIVTCVVEEPVGDAACVGAHAFVPHSNSNAAVSPDEGQPKKVVDEFLAKHGAPEPEFAEPNQRKRR